MGRAEVSRRYTFCGANYKKLCLISFAISLTVTLIIWVERNSFTVRHYQLPEGNITNVTEYPSDILDDIAIDCDAINRWDDYGLEDLKHWKFDITQIKQQLGNANDTCKTIRELFYFPSEPQSKEEAEYPLAYGMLVYNNIVQVLMMLSSFYHPQNQYCIAVSGSAGSFFKDVINTLPECFDNIHIMHRPTVRWGGYEILNSTFQCLKYLTESENDWKYYQYLSGVDVPLKTNREMVKIFKILNGTINLDVRHYPDARLRGKKRHDSPMPLFKSMLSTLIPREAARAVMKANKTYELLQFLEGTDVSDETFWASIMFNPEVLQIPGGFSATEILNVQRKLKKESPILVRGYEKMWKKPETIKKNNYISRLQYWNPEPCRGYMKSWSCVFGVYDVFHVLRQPHLVGHKFYFTFEPAAGICIIKEIRRRTRNPEYFDTSFYYDLPFVKMQRGTPLESVMHPEWFYGL